MTLPPLFSCEHCGTALNPNDDDTWSRISVWVKPRKAGYKLPSAPHAWACNNCMTGKIHTDQTSLF